MTMITVSGQMEQLDDFIDRCCLDGRIQVEQASDYISGTLHYLPLHEPNPDADRLAAIRQIAAAFGKELCYREEVRRSRGGDSTAVDDELLAALSEQMKELQDRRTALREEIEHDRTVREELSHFVGADLPMKELFGCRFVRCRFGRMPRENLDKLQRLDDNPYLLFSPCSYDRDTVWGVYFAPANRVDEIDRVFASLYFQRLMLPPTIDSPEHAVEEYHRRIREAEAALEKIDEQLRQYWEEQQENCHYIYSRLLYRNALHEVRSHVVTHGDYFVFVGWLPRREEAAVTAALEGLDVQAEITSPGKRTGHTPPTKLKNGGLIRPYEEFVEMYGVPGYRDIDPTLFLSVIYTLLFGIMFADLGQGLCVAALGLALWLRSRSRLGGILLRCGLSSAVFGTLFGSVFGNEEALDGFYENILHIHKPISIMQDITLILVAAIGIGVLLLIVAMCLNIAACIKRGHIGQALFGENGVAGIVAYSSLVLLILRFMGGAAMAALPVRPVVWALLVSFLLLYGKELLIGLTERRPDWKPESWGDYLLSNLFELIEYVLSYFSNTVSFLRVGAFVLVHAGMMLVVYSMAPAGGAARVIVLVLGNVLIMGIEGVLTYIQVLRLGFYEMFSRFYQGDGKPFAAFRLNPNGQTQA